MRSAASCILLILLNSGAFVPARAAAECCSIEGAVVSATTGEALNKAQLTLQRISGNPPQSYLAVTDGSGRFSFAGVEPGGYTLSVVRRGFLPQVFQRKTSAGSANVLALAPGQDLGDLLIRLEPYAAVNGTVDDEDGEPVQGATVQAVQVNWWEGLRQLSSAGGAQTNDLGEYRVYGLPPGKYYIEALYPQGRPFVVANNRLVFPEGGEDQTYLPTYYPGTTDPASASAISLGPGDNVDDIDLSLEPVRGVRIKGQVISSIGADNGRGIAVYLQPQRAGNVYAPGFGGAVLSQHGDFEIPSVPPGSYILAASAFADGKAYSARIPLDVGSSDLDDVSVTLQPGTELPGHLSIDGTAPFKLTDVQVNLQTPSPPFISTAGARVKEDGSFLLQNVSAGDYDVTVYAPSQDVYVKSISFGGMDSAGSAIQVSDGSSGGSLNLVLSDRAARVEGVVLDAGQKPVTQAFVVLVPPPGRRGESALYKQTMTDGRGHFNLSGIVPGQYKILAWSSSQGAAYRDPDFLSQFEDQGETLDLDEGGRQRVELRVIPLNISSP